MRATKIAKAVSVVLALGALLLPRAGLGDALVPPYADADDIPLPAWARSLASRKPELSVFASPTATASRRGTAFGGTRLPFYGAVRGAGCTGRWMSIGPLAWVCSDAVDMRAEEPGTQASPSTALASPPVTGSRDGLPYRYY
ncbi:hypothetical protein EON77_13955, partial [bacterium]